MRSLLFLGSSLSILALVGCTAGSSSDATGEDDYRSKPHGNDMAAGSLVVHAPPGAGVASGTVDLQVAPGGTKQLDQIFESVPIGTARFAMTVEGAGSRSRATVTVPIKSATLTEITLGGVAIKRAGMPITFGLADSAPAGGAMTKYADLNANASGSLGVDATSNGSSIIPAIAGEYTFVWGYGDGLVVPVTEGTTTKLDQWDYAQRAVARIIPPAARELPDACTSDSISPGTANLSTERGSTTIAVTKPVEVGQNPKVLAALGYTGARTLPLTLMLPCVSEKGLMKIPLGAVGAGPTDIKIGRLDVDDVEVTMPDGTKKAVRGSYRVLTADGTADVLRVRPATNTGVDLPPGTYKLVVEYKTSAGTMSSFTETFTTP